MAQDSFDIRKVPSLTQDSRAVKSGSLFAALPGSVTDGQKYISDAIRNGAAFILAPEGASLPADSRNVVLITDPNPRKRLSLMAAEFYNKQPERIVAVTGTNGKTSSVHFIWQIWNNLGFKSASLGTLGVRASMGQNSGSVRSGSMTTPDPVSLHAELADLASSGISHLAMEASSHGLHQYRLDGVKIQAAGFTSFSRDHMDYHQSIEVYLTAKARLFSEIVARGGVAVLNADIPEYDILKQAAQQGGLNIVSYGHQGDDLKIIAAQSVPDGQKLSLNVHGKSFEIVLPLAGKFQTHNALCALGLVLSEWPQDSDFRDQAVRFLESLSGAPGRLQRIAGHPKKAGVYVDYAHTPDALDMVLQSLRPHCQGRLVCIFGCGGDRDRGKRPLMGKIAAEKSDIAILTDDNPRSENPASIRAEVMAGSSHIIEIEGRAKAIAHAINLLEAGDILVITGKGHEQGQIFSDHTEPFCDVQQAEHAIEEIR
jgi:UDP-N-acetylmuramoyl-L-alanyl-D-glutamate--2,6-diaminopimelate ligase